MLRTCYAEWSWKSSARTFWKFGSKNRPVGDLHSAFVRVGLEGMLACFASSPQLVAARGQFRRLDQHANCFWTTTTGIKVPSDSAFKTGRTTAPSELNPRVSFTTRVMAETGEAAVPLIVVYVTVPNKETATSLATSIVTNKLAACVNQVPGVLSTYMWEGKVETEEEILLIIKTRRALLDSLTAHVKGNHPYTVPEVIALPILGGSDSYVQWVVDNTQKAGDVIPTA